MFLHGGLLHLLGNLWFLWIVGDNVEGRLGRFGYAIFYLTCGTVAGLAHVWANPRSGIPCVGASGAISGVLAGYVVLFPIARIRFRACLLFPFFGWRFGLPAFLAIGLWFLEQLGLGRLTEEGSGPTLVAYDAHIGGFLAGAILVGLLPTRRRRGPRRRRAARSKDLTSLNACG